MIETPWGDSESLRGRRLRPGPGVPREKVLANQRDRIFGAMVISVAERGYQATSVNHLVELSGVSSRTFYDLFADKRACFVATLEAIVAGGIAYIVGRTGAVADEEGMAAELSEDEWRLRAQTALDAFAVMVSRQPAASRLILIEAYAAGPDSLVPLRRTVTGFETVAREVLDRSPDRADMPAEMVTALIGALQEMARSRLLDDRQEELPEAIREAWQLLLTYRRPPVPLRLHGRPPKAGPETIEGHDHAERALRALSAVVAEVGYGDATVEAALRRGKMSAATFYAYFDGKEDALLAAIDSGAGQLIAATRAAFDRAPDWEHGIRAGFGAFFSFLAFRPSLAALLLVQSYVAGRSAIERRREALRPLEEMIAPGYELPGSAPRIATECILGATYTLGYRTYLQGGAGSLPSLAPLCTYITLSPFVGAEEAARIANGDGYGRGR